MRMWVKGEELKVAAAISVKRERGDIDDKLEFAEEGFGEWFVDGLKVDCYLSIGSKEGQSPISLRAAEAPREGRDYGSSGSAWDVVTGTGSGQAPLYFGWRNYVLRSL